MRGGLDHTPRVTRRTNRPGPTGEGDDEVVTTPRALGATEAMATNATWQALAEVAHDERRYRLVPRLDGRLEREDKF
jgi:hypothetical protein